MFFYIKALTSSDIFVETRIMITEYIADTQHYTTVLEKASQAKKHLWIGTADIKDLYYKKRCKSVPFLEVIADLIDKGISVRLIHAKEPGVAFRTDFDKYPALIDGLERMLCPRVHFKLIIIDFKHAYIGSANLTGAGLGMKSDTTRNFEA
ncbi:MAG: phospholipase D-like domain-containing protein, partial [Treponemataceae bacterium]